MPINPAARPLARPLARNCWCNRTSDEHLPFGTDYRDTVILSNTAYMQPLDIEEAVPAYSLYAWLRFYTPCSDPLTLYINMGGEKYGFVDPVAPSTYLIIQAVETGGTTWNPETLTWNNQPAEPLAAEGARLQYDLPLANTYKGGTMTVGALLQPRAGKPIYGLFAKVVANNLNASAYISVVPLTAAGRGELPVLKRRSTVANNQELTFTNPHGLRVGDTIDVRGMDQRYNAQGATVLAVPSTTVIRYASLYPQITPFDEGLTDSSGRVLV